MKQYKISIDGCDDSTYINISLTDNEAEVIGRVCDQSQIESTYGCMPTMSIEENNQ